MVCEITGWELPPRWVATWIFLETDGSSNLSDPKERLVLDKCYLPGLEFHGNRDSLKPTKRYRQTLQDAVKSYIRTSHAVGIYK